MATIELNKESFNSTVTGNDIVFVDFWAEWCGPCQAFGPVYEEVSQNNEDVVFAKVNTEDERELAEAFNITSIPTLMAVRDGVVLYSQAGSLPKPQLEQLLEQVRAVDMNQVKADIAKQEGAQG